MRGKVTLLAAVLTALALGGGTATAAPDVAVSEAEIQAAKPKFQLPFTCKTHVRVDTWDGGHDPALDITHLPIGETEGLWVRASAAGTVVQSYSNPEGAGNIIQVRHSGNWFTTYIHLKYRSVKKGDKIQQGKKIGAVGHTGETSNGRPHLHYEQNYSTGTTATWGYEGSQRKAAHFNGTKYTGSGKTWKLYSHNVGSQDGCG
ncbi:M23 family metallopeptidase [Amycolatopsis sp. lyj-112]|uniref:M23 family metallopeptidase n=1 Tax=Amycolatopsis sp. lyj-112 TaxID=2789288 RepID=UPI00397AFD8A